MGIDKKISYNALIGIQSGLFGDVLNFLRAVTVEVKETKVKVYFYYNGELSLDDKDALEMGVVMEYANNINNDIPCFVQTEEELIRLDAPAPIPKTGYLAYKRYEPGTFTLDDYLFPANFRQDLQEMYGSLIRPVILIAGQKALLNRVEDNLRKMRVAWGQKTIWLHFYYDDQITELNKKLAQAARDEFMQPFPDYRLEFKILLTEQMESYNKQHEWLGLFSRGRP